jgi:hypothetical protein
MAEGRPILIQGSEAPIIIRDNDNCPPLLCKGCNNSVLVENYLPACLVGVGLQCFKCGHVTWTPSMPPGEVFPARVVTLGDKGKFLIGSSIKNTKDVVITCNQELASVLSGTEPRSRSSDNFDLTVDNLDKISIELNILSGGNFEKLLQSAKRAVNGGSKYFRENPLAWAIESLKRQLNNNLLRMNESTLVAIGLIQGYRDIIERWQDHVHISHIAQELCASFNHTLVQFVAASYLSEHGNKVAVNPPDPSKRGRSADLYIRTSASEKLFFEVKAPKAVEWPNEPETFGKMKKIVEGCLSKSRGQLGTKNPGIIIIGTTCLSPGFLNSFQSAVKKVIKDKGRNHSGVAGVCIVGLTEVMLKRKVPLPMNLSTSFSVMIEKKKKLF